MGHFKPGAKGQRRRVYDAFKNTGIGSERGGAINTRPLIMGRNPNQGGVMSMSASELYRTSVKQLCRHFSAPEGIDPDKAFFDYLEENYNQSKRHWTEHLFESETEKQAAQNALFVFAVGVFACGKIEAASDIVLHLPSSGDIRRLALSLKALLPIPDDLDPLKDRQRMMQWLEVHANAMRWDESIGIYEEPKDRPPL
jgi:hypothetical protein